MQAAAIIWNEVPVVLTKADPLSPAFRVEGRDRIVLRTGTTASRGDDAVLVVPEATVAIAAEDMVPGSDLFVWLGGGGSAYALPPGANPIGPADMLIGGFHFAPGGNAAGRSGGDAVPAINPRSCWDLAFRPACANPRGMALVDLPGGGRIWADIYKLGTEHLADGTSRCGATIADGRDPPQCIDGKGRYGRLDYETAAAIMAHHGKQLLTYDEFRAAAFGATEKSAADRDPGVTGLDAQRTSQAGLMQATGNLWDWGTDGDPDQPRPSLFGGSWISGSLAGSRYASLGSWPGGSSGVISARGRSDHLQPE